MPSTTFDSGSHPYKRFSNPKIFAGICVVVNIGTNKPEEIIEDIAPILHRIDGFIEKMERRIKNICMIIWGTTGNASSMPRSTPILARCRDRLLSASPFR